MIYSLCHKPKNQLVTSYVPTNIYIQIQFDLHLVISSKIKDITIIGILQSAGFYKKHTNDIAFVKNKFLFCPTVNN
jgi:hypothetical protein